jgi:hypothetical protein
MPATGLRHQPAELLIMLTKRRQNRDPIHAVVADAEFLDELVFPIPSP